MEPELTAFPVIPSIDQDLSRSRFKETAGQIYERRFSGSRFADDRDRCSCGNMEVEMFKDILAAIRIAEGDVLKLDLTFNRLPVLLFRFKSCTVFGNYFGRIIDHRLFVQKTHDPFDIRLYRNHFGDIPGDILDRF